MPTVNQQDRAAAPDHPDQFAQFALVLRVQQPRNGAPADGKTALRVRAHALIKDILMSRLEIEAAAGPQEYVHAQGFADLGKALAASRALQLAFEGFRSAAPTARPNVSVVLDSFGAEMAGPSVEQKDLLDSAKPSQVLITQAFYKKIAHCQPLALRSFPPRAGAYEFLWTSEARLDELQAEPVFTPTLVSETPQPEATVISVREQPVAAAFPSPPADLEAQPAPFGVAHRALGWLRPHLPIITISASAMILIAICYLLIVHFQPGNRSKSAGPAPATVAAPVVPPAAAPSASQPSTAAVPASHPRSALTPPKPAGESGAGANNQNLAGTATVSKPGSRERECSIAGLIPNYLDLAEGNRIKGNYDAATREYTEVLTCEPNNHEALAGLRRVKDSERLNGISQ